MAEVALHPLLQYSLHNYNGFRQCCYILWDIREQSARHSLSPNTPLSDFELTQHASSPPLTRLHVICDVLPEHWAIEARNPRGVTIRDVLAAVYTALHAPLKSEEWERLCPKQRDRISVVFNARTRAALDPSNTWANGIARVDCLLRHTGFGGLTMSLERRDVYILTLRHPMNDVSASPPGQHYQTIST